MSEINVTLGFDGYNIRQLVEEMVKHGNLVTEDTISDEVENKFDEIFEDRFDDKLDQTIEEKLDDKMDDKIESYMNYHYDMEGAVEDVLSGLSFSNYISSDDIDLSPALTNLIQSYDPGNGCELGNAFTEAVRTAVFYLLSERNSFALMIKDSIERAIASEAFESMREKVINEYKTEVENYFRNLQLPGTSNNFFTTSNVKVEQQNYQY